MTTFANSVRPTGALAGVLTRGGPVRRAAPWYWRLRQRPGFIASYLWGWLQTAVALWLARTFHLVSMTGEARGEFYDHTTGVLWDLGVTSRRVVTDALVALMVDAMDTAQALFDDFDFMAFGSGTTAEGAAQTALVTEFTTQYASDNVRPTATISQPAANQFRAVATFAPDAGCTLEELAVMNANAGACTMMDRCLTGTQVMAVGDTYTGTYTLTITSGG
jgi:hypothetical protein